jgi:uncharacterized DUF497 family protein
MIDWSRVEGFDWDDGNAGKLAASDRGISLAEVEQVFLNEPLIVGPDQRHSVGEPRFHALGKTDHGSRLFVSFTLRRQETLVRIISARVMNRKERNRYEQQA